MAVSVNPGARIERRSERTERLRALALMVLMLFLSAVVLHPTEAEASGDPAIGLAILLGAQVVVPLIVILVALAHYKPKAPVEAGEKTDPPAGPGESVQMSPGQPGADEPRWEWR